MMRTSDKGLAFLACHEGMVLRAYKDAVGMWTIGIGHTAAAGPPVPKPGMRIDEIDAMKLFMKDIERYEGDVRRVLHGVAVPQHVFDAMVSFHFNTGAIGRARFVRTIREVFSGGGDVEAGLARAGRQLMYWRKPRAIIGRRKREYALLVHGDYGDTSRMLVIPEVTSNHAPRWSAAKTVDPMELIRWVREDGRPVAMESGKADRKVASGAWPWWVMLAFASGVAVGILL